MQLPYQPRVNILSIVPIFTNLFSGSHDMNGYLDTDYDTPTQAPTYEVPNARLVMKIYDSQNNEINTIEKAISSRAASEWENLQVEYVAQVDGHVEVFIVNEDVIHPVYFDNLKIQLLGEEKPLILQENHYYPFGMNMKGIENEPEKYHKFQYNGKEKQTELGLNWVDYGARNYQADLGRWFGIDPLAEAYYSFTPYNYVMDNPISFIDPDGRSAASATFGAVNNWVKGFGKDEDNGDEDLPDEVTLTTETDVFYERNGNDEDGYINSIIKRSSQVISYTDSDGRSVALVAVTVSHLSFKVEKTSNDKNSSNSEIVITKSYTATYLEETRSGRISLIPSEKSNGEHSFFEPHTLKYILPTKKGKYLIPITNVSLDEHPLEMQVAYEYFREQVIDKNQPNWHFIKLSTTENLSILGVSSVAALANRDKRLKVALILGNVALKLIQEYKDEYTLHLNLFDGKWLRNDTKETIYDKKKIKHLIRSN